MLGNLNHRAHCDRACHHVVKVLHLKPQQQAVAIGPLFALANAGVNLRSEAGLPLGSPVLWGVVGGLVLGKPLGVLLASWLAVKTRIAALPEGATWGQVAGVAILCGIAFTMSLFIANLAFPGLEDLLAATKLGILAASLCAGAGGAAIIVIGRRRVARRRST